MPRALKYSHSPPLVVITRPLLSVQGTCVSTALAFSIAS